MAGTCLLSVGGFETPVNGPRVKMETSELLLHLGGINTNLRGK